MPTTFMNESGNAVGPLARRYEVVDPLKIIIVHDELDLAPGVVRVKVGGGLAGHNGLRSITQHLKSQDFVRVRIGVGKLRGVESVGMLCSARELKLSEDHGGLLELPLDAPLGQNIREYLNLDDTLFTLKLTPNLAHCLSVYGVAREVAALTGAPLKTPAFPAVAVALDDKLPVKVSAPDLCGRFSGRIVRNVNTQAKTPQWMVDRLARCGQRSVTALVDISNYVMFELGRPSHIFDLDKIHGGLDVRWGKAGEQLKLLNGHTVEVDEKVGVIADDSQVESLAGIMGGDATAVGDDTRHAPRPWKTSPAFPGLEAELPAGAPMDHPLFPVLFPVPSPSAL